MSDKSSPVPEGLRADIQWRALEGRLCRIHDFKPFPGNEVVNDEVLSSDKSVPYAGFIVECVAVPENKELIGYCTHKNDFVSLWSIFKSEYYDPKAEEVLMFWTRKHYNRRIFRVMSLVSPKMVVFKAKKGTYEKNKNMIWSKGKPLSEILSELNIESIVYIPVALQRKK